jgi:hypothetical protein
LGLRKLFRLQPGTNTPSSNPQETPAQAKLVWIRYCQKNNKKIFPPLIDDGSSKSSGGTFRARRRNGGGTRE